MDGTGNDVPSLLDDSGDSGLGTSGNGTAEELEESYKYT